MTQHDRQLQGNNLVVGLGKTGLSVVRFLSRKGFTVAVNDSREAPPGLDELKEDYPDVARFTGNFNEMAFAAAERLIVNPGISVKHPMIAKAHAKGVEVVGDIELFARYVDKPVIAITGSNGKTTVTTLLGEMARQSGLSAGVGGNIGTPALDLLEKGHDLYVLELSSFQLETLYSLKPVAAVVLNVSEDHMDRYDGLDDYAQVKASIYRFAENAIINCDDDIASQQEVTGNVIGFSLSAPDSQHEFGLVNDGEQDWLAQGDKQLMPVKSMLLAGKHNQANALAALALGYAAGIETRAMLATLRQFSGLPHRTQFVAEINQVRFYNDSKATNVGACLAALNGLRSSDGCLTVNIMGGDCKSADFSSITKVIAETCRAVVLIGRDAGEIQKHLPAQLKVINARSLLEAVELAYQAAQPGDRVLLSPACASFDMFSGFEDRGNQFIKMVEGLKS